MSSFLRLFYGKGNTSAYALMSAILAFLPEDAFILGFISCEWPKTAIVICNKIFLFIILLIVCNVINFLYKKLRKSVTISDKNTTIFIEYGDIFRIKHGWKVINFDECFTTKIGSNPGDIKPESICGQYLTRYPIEDMQQLIEKSGIKPKGYSQYENKECYEHGVIIPRDDFLLMAFARLDKKGRGFHTYESYLKCLDKLWEQIDLYHGTDDVYLPILGSRITRFDKDLTQQDLLDIMISSYRLNPKKLKKPNSLHIVCKERDDFSLNRIWGVD